MKKVLVTGGTGQIGKAIVENFLEMGCYVFIHGSKKETLDNLVVEFDRFSGMFETIELDANEILNLNGVASFNFDSVDILVNAVGGGGVHETWANTTNKKWLDIYNLNVLVPVYFIKMVIESMKEKGHGRIINISSVSATKTLSIGPEYNAAKAALVNLSQSLAQEFKNTSVTVNSISPGLVYTDTVKKLMCETYNLDSYDDTLINKVISDNFFPNLLYGLPTANEIAKLTEFLCSSSANHITGQNFIIDSGYSLSNYVESSVE